LGRRRRHARTAVASRTGSKSFHLEHSFDTSEDRQYTVTVRLSNGLATAVGTTRVT
jgi:hypothetical protein